MSPEGTIGMREALTNAIRYWERRRIVYNLVLTGIVLTHLGQDFKRWTPSVSVNLGLLLFVLAVLANVAYCAAYVVDVFAQVSGFREEWWRFRWILFAIGLTFAGVLTHFFAAGMFVS